VHTNKNEVKTLDMDDSNTDRKSVRFPELTVSGSPFEMGRQIGEHFRPQIVELSELVLERFNKGSLNPITWSQAESTAQRTFAGVGDRFPSPMEELQGTAGATGVPIERLMVLNARNMLSEALGAAEGCTSIMVAAESSKSGSGFAGQNWDNDPAMGPLSAVITRKGTGKATFTSWMQPGLVAYMGFNSAGIGICMNALNGPANPAGVPWYFFVRAILESNSAEEAVRVAESTPRSITANAAMITREGPLNLELTPGRVEKLGPDGKGLLVHTNHCVHPSLASNNELFENRIYGQSFARKDRGQVILEQRMDNGKLSVEDAKVLLSDHEGHPTSICRHPNEDPVTGWQRSVISLILEPDEHQMHVSNGNPCENVYETYVAG